MLVTPFRGWRGRLVSRLLVLRDSTARKKLEQELRRQADNLEVSNEELLNFAYAASHDLQEPLRMITSHLDLLQKRCGEKMDESAYEFIDFAVEGAQRMQGLLADLLAYSQVGTEGRSLIPVDLNTVVGETKENLKLAIEESGAVVSLQPLPILLGDKRQIFQRLHALGSI